MNQENKPEIIILRYGDIQINIPKSKQAISITKGLLQMLEEELNEEPQGRAQTEIPKIGVVCPPEPPGPKLNGKELIIEVPHSMELNVIPVKISEDCARDQGAIETKTGTQPEQGLNRILDVPVEFFIPKFEWDKSKEKPYRTIFFFEHEDERVMILYQNSRVFTMKEAVMSLPYPIPRNYAPLRTIQINKRTALKFYREYLAKEAHSNEIAAAIHDDEKDKGEAATESEEKRLEKLRRSAKVNKDRWKERVENEASERTKELRSKFALKATMGIGAEQP